MKNIRVRFAPSPTGGLHIGGVRTALFNYLFAKKHNGTFILRIEDTDQSRFVEGAEAYIKDSLQWCGIIPDEGPDQGGPHAPYRQSERSALYQSYAQKLLDDGNAYYAFDTPEDLEQMRERLNEAGVVNLNYNSASRMTMKNSLTLSPEEVSRRIASGDPYVIRLKVPPKEEIRVNDLIRGWVMVHSSTLDDKVILKSDGLPTYHLANVVDDYLMKISHVIRGEEWLPSAPAHVLLYKYLGWENEMPVFAHLPLILKPDGNGKLSKRAADKAGFPIFPLNWQDPNGEMTTGFREAGYLPGALVNFLAFLGWNPGTDQEIFTMEELIASFSIERIGKSGTKFDIDKARWYNQQYLGLADHSQLLPEYLKGINESFGAGSDPRQAEEIIGLLKNRVTFPQDLVSESRLFFVRPTDYDHKVVAKKWNEEAKKGLKEFAKALAGQQAPTSDQIQSLYHTTLTEIDIQPGKIMQILRVALTGEGSGPDLMKIIELLGVTETTQRIQTASESFDQTKEHG